MSLVLTQVVFALLGGNAFAGERVDRSAEFLTSLPIARAKVVSSKLLFVAIIVVVTWLVNSPFIVHLSSEFPARPGQPNELSLLGNIAITGLVFFCVAWLLSSFLSSPTFAVGGGLVAPFLVIGTLSLIAYLFAIVPTEAMAEFWYSAICLTLAPLCFLLGTCYYLRRVEP